MEVLIARMFLDPGMHRDLLLARLLADSELSIQSILQAGHIMGEKNSALCCACDHLQHPGRLSLWVVRDVSIVLEDSLFAQSHPLESPAQHRNAWHKNSASLVHPMLA